MDSSNKVVEIILDIIFFILPVAGATLWLFKVLVKNVCNTKDWENYETEYKSIVIKIALVSLPVLLGLFLCFFMAWLIFFPSFKLPILVKILGFILYAVFWGCTGILYGLGRAVAAGTGSATGILDKLFKIMSEKNTSLNKNFNMNNQTTNEIRRENRK